MFDLILLQMYDVIVTGYWKQNGMFLIFQNCLHFRLYDAAFLQLRSDCEWNRLI